MKKRNILLCLTCIWVAPLMANQAEQPREPSKKHSETRMLIHLLEMESNDLAQLRQTIERIEQMTPEERAVLRERIYKLQKMKPERIDAMRQRFEAIPPEAREAMRQRWINMSREERKAWQQKLRGMSEEERAKAFEDNGFLPDPGKPPRGEKPPRPPAE